MRNYILTLKLLKLAVVVGTVAQPVAPTTFGLDAHGGHRFDSGLMSFLLSTPRLFYLSFPVPLWSSPLSPPLYPSPLYPTLSTVLSTLSLLFSCPLSSPFFSSLLSSLLSSPLHSNPLFSSPLLSSPLL